jgi:hypothetical protein
MYIHSDYKHARVYGIWYMRTRVHESMYLCSADHMDATNMQIRIINSFPCMIVDSVHTYRLQLFWHQRRVANSIYFMSIAHAISSPVITTCLYCHGYLSTDHLSRGGGYFG